MAANFETGFFVKEPAWHGLGTVVSEAPTSEEALRLAGLDWDVISTPVMVEGQEAEGYKANVRSSDKAILGIVSDRYKIVQNREGFAFLDDLLKGELPVKFETAGALAGGKRVWMLAYLPSEKILDDEIVPYLVFSNGHDGMHNVSVCMTPIRVVCQNTLTAAIRSAKRSWSFRHMGDMDARKREASETLMLANQYTVGLREFAETMAKKRISKKALEDIVGLVFPLDNAESDREKKNVEKLRGQFMEIINNVDDLQNNKMNGWGVYNAFADFATHITPLRKTDTFQEKLFASFIDGNSFLDNAQKILENVA